MIDYGIIDSSIKYYEKLGYQRVESPWTVSESIDAITRPKDKIPFQLKHNDKCLVGSGEQSFLYLYLKGFLPKGLLQTVTPCFRNESFDLLHSKYFIKNELINTVDVTNSGLEKMIDNALMFYKLFLPNSEVVKTDIGFDIMDNDNELGSYGIGECDFLSWIYGTGCAEPRLSTIIELNKKQHEK